MRVVIAGASGAIGLPLVRQLISAGHDVVALHRSAQGQARLAAAGASLVQVDVLDRAGLLGALRGQRADAVIAQLTALRKAPATHRDMAATNVLRTRGTRNLLDAAQQLRATRFLTQSMAFGYGYGDWSPRVLTEADPFAPPGQNRFEEHLAAMRDNETQVLTASHVDGIALRYGLFYGPGPASDALVESVRRRRQPVVRDAGVLPWLFIDDAAAATVAALERGEPGNAYNVADDEPVSISTMVTAIATAVGAPTPRVVPRWLLSVVPYAKAIVTGGLRVSSEKAKRELGWTPQAPTYRDGIRRMREHYHHVAA